MNQHMHGYIHAAYRYVLAHINFYVEGLALSDEDIWEALEVVEAQVEVEVEGEVRTSEVHRQQQAQLARNAFRTPVYIPDTWKLSVGWLAVMVKWSGPIQISRPNEIVTNIK